MKLATAVLVLAVLTGPRLQGQDRVDVVDLLRQKGPPAFIARAADANGSALICDDLKLFDPTQKLNATQFRGCVLIYCEGWDALSLGAAHAAWKMQRATAGMGQEKPGDKLLNMKLMPAEPYPLPMPVRLQTVTIDADGKAAPGVTIVIHYVRSRNP